MQLIKHLPNLDEKNKDKPLCYPYSVKARALLHAHFQRLDLPPDTLAIGRWTQSSNSSLITLSENRCRSRICLLTVGQLIKFGSFTLAKRKSFCNMINIFMPPKLKRFVFSFVNWEYYFKKREKFN